MSNYVKNKSWNLIFEDNLLVVTAGADRIYAIEDVSKEVGQEITELWNTNPVRINGLSDASKEVFEQLLTAGVFQPKLDKRSLQKIRVEFIGDSNPTILRELSRSFKSKDIRLDGGDQSFRVFVRTNGKLKDIVDGNYKDVEIPHLLVDLSYDHTISIGPLVIPEDTACLACLVGRLSNYWGDAQPPEIPAITKNVTLIASFVAMQVESIVNGDQSLVNKTVAYDFQNHQLKSSTIYKLPWCPRADKEKRIAGTGYIELPWVKQDRK